VLCRKCNLGLVSKIANCEGRNKGENVIKLSWIEKYGAKDGERVR